MKRSSSRQPPENPMNISGLEKAIILIAFIVIVTMFTYTALTTELFTTSQDTEPVIAEGVSPNAANTNIGGE